MKNQTDPLQFDYAAKTAQLDAVLAALQSPEIALDEAIKLHTQGAALVEELEQYLANAEVIIQNSVG